VAPTAKLLVVAMAYVIAGAPRNASCRASLRYFFCDVVPVLIIYLGMRRTDGDAPWGVQACPGHPRPFLAASRASTMRAEGLRGSEDEPTSKIARRP
jgi:hypothetical protein